MYHLIYIMILQQFDGTTYVIFVKIFWLRILTCYYYSLYINFYISQNFLFVCAHSVSVTTKWIEKTEYGVP